MKKKPLVSVNGIEINSKRVLNLEIGESARFKRRPKLHFLKKRKSSSKLLIVASFLSRKKLVQGL